MTKKIKTDLNPDCIVNLRVKKDLLDKYRVYCTENGFCMSKRIRNFIESEVKPKK